MTASLLIVDGLPIEVTRKKIKHLNLTVQPPEGRVTVSAPHRMGDGEPGLSGSGCHVKH